MKIKKTVLLSFCLLIISVGLLRSQTLPNFINSEQALTHISECVQLDSSYQFLHDSLYQIGVKKVKTLQERYIEYMKFVERCNGPVTNLKDREKEILKQQEAIINYEAFIVDTLPNVKQEVKIILNHFLKEEVTAYAKANKLQLVVDTKEVLYYDPAYDISNEIIKHLTKPRPQSEAKASFLAAFSEVVSKYKLTQRIENLNKNFQEPEERIK